MKKLIKKIGGKKLFNILRNIKKKLLNQVDELQLIHEYLVKTNSNYGIMVDVGVHYGESSISFLNDGWKVIGFEPDKKNRDVIGIEIKDHENFTMFNFALSNEKGEMNFYTSEESSGISSLLNFHESHIITGTVKVETLRNIIEENKIDNIKLLKIDAEGYDFLILKGFDFEKHYNPEFIICEFEDRKTVHLNYSVYEMIEFLNNLGYMLLVFEWEPIKKYGGHHKFKRAKIYPCDINPNSWGNLIAFKDENFTHFALNKLK